MSEARHAILARIRQATRRQASAEASEALAAQRLAQHPRGPLPAFAETAVTRFIHKLQQASASVISVDSLDAAVPAIDAYLQQHGLPRRLVTAAAPLLNDLAWPGDYAVEQRLATAADPVVLSVAFAGIAETGTLALLSGSETPTSLNFLPDDYICLLQQQDLVSHMEEVWERIRARPGGMPRTLNYISGPSRTADVEQTIQLGAHGPRRLLVILVNNGG